MIGTAQKRWMEAVERRVDAITKILGSMKSIKMAGLMHHAADMAHAARVDELKISLALRRFISIGVGLCQ